MLVILLAAISFIGYIAVKILGTTRGELVSGVVGGLVSSTGTTLTNARRAADGADARTLAAGTLGESAVSCLLTAVLTVVLAPAVMWGLLASLAAAAIVMVVYALILARNGPKEHAQQMTKNPFEIRSVFILALTLVAAGFMARADATWFGEQGLLVVSLLSGLADVDAATLTVMGMGTLSTSVSSFAIALAMASNIVAKAADALLLGSWAFGLRVAAGSALAVVAGAIIFWAMPT